jgi:hypothetical protein
MIDILISGQRVYSGSEISLGINKKIYDLFEPDKRASDQTLTVDLVGSKEVDRLFRGLFDVNVFVGTNSPTFDPSKKAPAIIYADTIEQLNGFVQLTDIVITNEQHVIYKVAFYGRNADLFKKLGDRKLSDLDLSEYDHIWNYDNITNSWATSVIQNGSPVSFELGKGYFYPMEYTSRDGQKERPDNWYVRYWRPWVYFKTILDRIVLEAGFDYNSTFLNSERFKRLIYNGDVVNEKSEDEIAASVVEVSKDATQNVSANFTDLTFPIVAINSLTQWDTTNNWFEPDKTDRYNLTCSLLYNFRYTNAGGTYTDPTLLVNAELVIFDTITNTDVVIGTLAPVGNKINGNFITGDNKTGYIDLYFPDVRMRQGVDIAFVRIKSCLLSYGNNNLIDGFVLGVLDINSGSLFSAQLSPIVEEGTVIPLSRFIGELTQKDWLMGVAKMFNLYFDPQPDGSLLIEPRDDGFFTNQLIDLTKQLDVSKDFTIKPLEQSKYRQYKYTYTQGKDSLNQSYEDGWGEVYGALTYQPENEFAKETKEVKLPFSLPIQARSPIAPSVKSPRVIPSFLNPQNEERYKPTGVPRVLIVDGLRGTLQSWTFENIVWNFYPYAGQMDSLDTPTIDLAFGEPNSIYWLREGRNDVAYPENISLFWQYHYQELTQLTSKNSKIVECYIKITPSLYSQMTFRKLYFINNAYYRLYEIEDYSPLNEDTTKCVLLKLDIIPALPITNRNIYGGGGVSDIGDTFVGDRSGDRVIASGNSVQSLDGGVVLGTNNAVSNGLKSIIIGGDTNQVTTSDALVWGLNNQSVDQSGVHLGYNIIEISNQDLTLTGSEGSPLYIFKNGGAGYFIELGDPANNRGKYVCVNKSGTGSVEIREEGSAIETLSNEHSATFLCTGTAWRIIHRTSL